MKFLSTSAVYPGSISDDLRWLLKRNLFVTGGSFISFRKDPRREHVLFRVLSRMLLFSWRDVPPQASWPGRGGTVGSFSQGSRYLLNPRPLYCSPASPATQKIAALNSEPGCSGHEPHEDHSQLLLSPVISPRWLLPLVAFPVRDIWHCRHQRDFSGDSCGVRMALN